MIYFFIHIKSSYFIVIVIMHFIHFLFRQSPSVPERFTIGEVLYFGIRTGYCKRYSIRALVQPTKQPRQSLTC